MSRTDHARPRRGGEQHADRAPRRQPRPQVRSWPTVHTCYPLPGDEHPDGEQRCGYCGGVVRSQAGPLTDTRDAGRLSPQPEE